MKVTSRWTAPFAILALFCAAVPAQEAETKRAMTLEDFALWRSVTSTGVSDDGTWISYGYRKRDTDDQLILENLRTGKKHEIERASALASLALAVGRRRTASNTKPCPEAHRSGGFRTRAAGRLRSCCIARLGLPKSGLEPAGAAGAGDPPMGHRTTGCGSSRRGRR